MNYGVGLKSDSEMGQLTVIGCQKSDTVTSANHIKCTELNPPITQFVTITTATTTYPAKLRIF